MEEDDWSDSVGSCEETPGIDGDLDNRAGRNGSCREIDHWIHAGWRGHIALTTRFDTDNCF